MWAHHYVQGVCWQSKEMPKLQGTGLHEINYIGTTMVAWIWVLLTCWQRVVAYIYLVSNPDLPQDPEGEESRLMHICPVKAIILWLGSKRANYKGPGWNMRRGRGKEREREWERERKEKRKKNFVRNDQVTIYTGLKIVPCSQAITWLCCITTVWQQS